MDLIAKVQTENAAEIENILATFPSYRPSDFVSRTGKFSANAARKALNIGKLIGDVSSAKVEKTLEKRNIATGIMYLSPEKQTGHVFGQKWNMCVFASERCAEACLSGSGRAKMAKDGFIWGRAKKTALYFLNRELFMAILHAELTAMAAKYEKKGIQLGVRLNGTSDIPLRNFMHEGVHIFDHFPGVQFYDYTKMPSNVTDSEKYKNHHITFSYSGEGLNVALSEAFIKEGKINVAVVFEGELPATFMGKEVILEEDDWRVADKRGAIVGLYFKSVRNDVDLKDNPFVIALDDPRRG